MAALFPLPLSQQVLAWLILALGYENSTPGLKLVSSGTLKNARSGNVIARSWNDLVGEVTRLLGLKPLAPETLHGLLRQWDAQVSSRRPPELETRDALLPVLRLLVPRLGVRLGALAALAAHRTGNAPEALEWLFDPFSPKTFRRVLDRVVLNVHPELTSRHARYDRLLHLVVDERTLERWDEGAVPNPKHIASFVELLGAAAEAPLRWARAGALLRDRIQEGVGVGEFTSWREAVQLVASATVGGLSDPDVIPRVAELYVDDLARTTTPETEVFLAEVARSLGVAPRTDDTSSWLQRVAAARHGGPPPSAAETRAVLTLLVLSPHPRLFDAAMAQLGARRSDTLAWADPWRWIDNEWSLLGVLRHLADGRSIEWELPNGRRRTVEVPPQVAEAARRMRQDAGCFVSSHETVDRPDQDQSIVLSFLADDDRTLLQAELAAAASEAPLAMIDRALERSMSHDEVVAWPELALARARRLAEAGDLAGVGEFLETIDVRGHPLDPQARRDVAHLLIGIAHASLDRFCAAVREWSALRDELAAESAAMPEEVDAAVGAPIVSSLAHLDRMHDSALSHLGRLANGEAATEALVLSLPYLIRRRRLLDALEREDTSQPDARAAAERVAARAKDEPNDGEIAAMHALALWWRGDGGKALVEADKRCEHLGTATLRDRWKARLESDLSLSKVAGSGRSTGEA